MRKKRAVGVKAVGVKIVGGLGNQMFQYAAAYALAKHYNAELLLDISFYKSQDKRNFLLDDFHIEGVVKDKISDFTLYNERFFDYDPEILNISDENIVLNGYFQTEKYFFQYRKELLDIFSLKTEYSDSYHAISKKIKNAPKSVAIHIRRGDYIQDPHTKNYHGILEVDYYLKAVQYMERLVGHDNHYFIFTDDYDAANSELMDIGNVTVITDDGRSPIEDMDLMSKCDHIILANSSYSWWGAWLNQNPEQQVIAPLKWFGTEKLRHTNMVDLYRSNWIILP